MLIPPHGCRRCRRRRRRRRGHCEDGALKERSFFRLELYNGSRNRLGGFRKQLTVLSCALRNPGRLD